MARFAREQILYDGCLAHVFSKSMERRRIFKEKEDFDQFLKLLAEVKRERKFLIHHYCLMNTHFHMAVSIPDVAGFSKGLQWLKSKYTYWFNGKNKRVGPLWRERFKSLVIENQQYLSACGQYIENNPVKAGLVGNPENWPYGSGRHYFQGKADDLVDDYEHMGLPEDADMGEDEEFVRGIAIGSPLFKMYLKEDVVGCRPVPM